MLALQRHNNKYINKSKCVAHTAHTKYKNKNTIIQVLALQRHNKI
jgi:hypothetical protein